MQFGTFASCLTTAAAACIVVGALVAAVCLASPQIFTASLAVAAAVRDIGKLSHSGVDNKMDNSAGYEAPKLR
jgi:hypothetical protein